MPDIREWMLELKDRLIGVFGDRLLFLGLQGSRRRGEAEAGSDIDAVVVLDRLDVADLALYRRILADMPDSALACGFIGGREELRNWPRHELFQFARDTEACHGELEPLLPPIGDDDARRAVAIGASGVYHGACHLYTHGAGEARTAGLRGLYKAAFFVLQASHYLRTGVYKDTKRGLLDALEGGEREILSRSIAWEPPGEDEIDHLFALLVGWSGRLLHDFHEGRES